jgi:hypothetical protein
VNIENQNGNFDKSLATVLALELTTVRRPIVSIQIANSRSA